MNENIRAGYNAVAADYAENFRDELLEKPFDRKMLDWLIERVGDLGPICDMGCGPGQIARYLADHGGQTCGIDLSDEMISQAQAANPGLVFEQGDMTRLTGIPDSAFGGIAAFYSIIHVPTSDLRRALSELNRVLRTGGTLLVTFHIGTETIHRDEWWGKEVSIDFNFFQTDEIKRALQSAGFEFGEVIERDPYQDEYQSRRAYLFAVKT